ncbi:MAG: hypothetical protein Q9180_002438 [Flavoplaca navasiana]
MSFAQIAVKSTIIASPILILAPFGIGMHYLLKKNRPGIKSRVSTSNEPYKAAPMTAKKIQVQKPHGKKAKRKEPEHWYVREDANKENFEDYWGYLFGGFEASRGHRHRFGEPLAMEVTPIFCEDGSGELVRIVVSFVFNEGQDKGELWREISIEVPTGEEWDNEAWEDRIVHIREYDGYTVVLAVQEFERSDLQAFRMAVDDLIELLEL